MFPKPNNELLIFGKYVSDDRHFLPLFPLYSKQLDSPPENSTRLNRSYFKLGNELLKPMTLYRTEKISSVSL